MFCRHSNVQVLNIPLENHSPVRLEKVTQHLLPPPKSSLCSSIMSYGYSIGD